MELQLIRLWRTPAEAIPELYGLSQGRLRDTIRQHLGQCVPADREAEGAIRLPWSWQSRSATEQAMLQEMGLGGGLPVTHLRRPGRLWLGVGACAGLAMGAALAVWLRPETIPIRPPQVLHEATLPAALQPYVGTWIDPQRTADGQWPVSVTVPKAAACGARGVYCDGARGMARAPAALCGRTRRRRRVVVLRLSDLIQSAWGRRYSAVWWSYVPDQGRRRLRPWP